MAAGFRGWLLVSWLAGLPFLGGVSIKFKLRHYQGRRCLSEHYQGYEVPLA